MLMRAAPLAITGVGITCAVGQGKQAVWTALLEARHAFDVMKRPGRQKQTNFIGAEIGSLVPPAQIPPDALRTVGFSAQVAVATLDEAWREATLADVDPERIGLIVGGSNLQQRHLTQMQDSYAARPKFLRPTYGIAFMDTDLCGVCTEHFGIRGLALTVGGASASGQLAIIQSINAVLAGQVDVCIALGALMDLSFWELQALRSLGAMGSDRYADAPQLASRPFDSDRDGFIYGECCGAVVIERVTSTTRCNVHPYAWLSGWSVSIDGNRNPDPSLEGEIRAIRGALECAGRAAAEIDYINPHGSGSVVGDAVELQALRRCGLQQAHINATKSIVGHGLSAAGAVEVAATLLQMRHGQLHPARNLDNPIDAGLNWVKSPLRQRIQTALTLSFGFGGINTALCLERA